MAMFCLPGTMPDWGEDEEEIDGWIEIDMDER
jgi:hypothetical protein